MSQLLVLAPPDVADGFALGGAATRVVGDPADTVAAVDAAASGDAAVIAVHHELWPSVPAPLRRAWEARTDVLVLPLPADDGATTTDRHDALRDLLAAAVGYEISFVPEGGPA